jgi:SAM-dependent methyltransferase
MKTTEEILETNKKQAAFYNEIKQNSFTKLWAHFRNGILNKIRKNIGIINQTYDLHKQWFGDLSDKKVLDLGCYSGNTLSLHLAQNAKQYIGIDLSNVAIDKLKEKLKPFPNASAIAVDFLSNDFKEKDFDLIYAYGVLHHFPNIDILINRLNQVMSSEAKIISYDPLQTSWPVKFLRILYRPFQSDAAWEWPFTKIIDRRGILGKSKWIYVINFLPISNEKIQKIGLNWHQHDWETSNFSDKSLFKCMHVTMLMQKDN